MRHTHAMIESMETRRMMSVTPAGGEVLSEALSQPVLLLPAVQKVREAAARSTPSLGEIVVTKPTDCASVGL